jgi:hypothetical protein
MTKQDRWRKAKIEQGLCGVCGKRPLASTVQCQVCLERKRPKDAKGFRERYHKSTWAERHASQMRVRRFKALKRMKERNARREATDGTLPK